MSDINGSRRRKKKPDLSASLRDFLECPVCLEVPRIARYYSCQGGHILCQQCFQLLDLCPLCRRPLQDAQRQLFVERLRDQLIPQPCKNSHLGCPEELLMNQLMVHEGKCDFSPVPCSFATNGCPETPQRRQLQRHVDTCEWQTTPCPLCPDRPIIKKDLMTHLTLSHLSLSSGVMMSKQSVAILVVLSLSLLMNVLLLCLLYL